MRHAVILTLCLGLMACGLGRDAAESRMANKVIETTRSVCRFAPTVASVLSLLSVPGAGGAEAVAEQICRQVAKIPPFRPASLGLPVTVDVDGVPVTGRFVR